MKFTSKQLQIAAITVGVSIILFGIFRAIFKFEMDAKLESDIATYAMLGGFALLIWSRKVRKEENRAAEDKSEIEDAAETPEKLP